MKQLISKESYLYWMMGIGIIALLGYGFLITSNETSADMIKTSIIACGFAVLFPLALTIKKMEEDFEDWIFWGMVIGVGAIILLIAYSNMNKTSEGVLLDLFAEISTDSYRWLYFVVLLLSIICPFVWKKGAPWVTAITIGILMPAILTAIIVILFITLVCYILAALGKSNSSSSAGISSRFSDSSTSKQQENKPVRQDQVKGIDNRRYASLIIEFVNKSSLDSYYTSKIKNPYTQIETLPLDFTYEQIAKYLSEKYQYVDIVVVNTKIRYYRERDAVDPIAWKIAQ